MYLFFTVNINLPLWKFGFIHRLFRQTDACHLKMIRKKSTQGDKERLLCVCVCVCVCVYLLPLRRNSAIFSENFTTYKTSRRKKKFIILF